MKKRGSVFRDISAPQRGVSVMIGYILLITLAIVMSIIVYQWLKTYVPTGEVECPDETSFFVKEYACSEGELNLTLQNNGRFGIGGYYIKATETEDQEVATQDLSLYLQPNIQEAVNITGRIFFTRGEAGNHLGIGEQITNTFMLPNDIFKLDLIPLRFQEVGQRSVAVSCPSSRIEYSVTCQDEV